MTFHLYHVVAAFGGGTVFGILITRFVYWLNNVPVADDNGHVRR